jgi:hypothetical protein
MSGHSWNDDDQSGGAKDRKFFEFDCPSCNANNPWPDGFENDDEINCHYCGTTLQARVSDEGKLKLREV